MTRVLLARSQVLTGSLLALTILATGSLQTVKADQMGEPRIGLEGYCPVYILDANKWVKGSPEHQATYDGVTYYFQEEAIKQKFLANPAKYVPALGGDCTVCYAKMELRVPGSVNHSARYDNRLFLFPGAEQQQAFLSNPQEFADVDLALKGDCAVCLVHHNKRVAGKPEFAEIKDGLRYLFVSAREQAAFRKDPAAYVAPAPKPTAMMAKTTSEESKRGVMAIQNSEEPGLALNATGSVQTVKADQMGEPRIGLGGYCPVCILDANKWVKGSPEHQATYDGVTYYFPDDAIKQKFLENPAKSVPALGGDCIVCYAKLGKRVPGNVNHSRGTTTGCSSSPARSSNRPSSATRRSTPTPTLRGTATAPSAWSTTTSVSPASPSSRRSRTGSATCSCPPASKPLSARTPPTISPRLQNRPTWSRRAAQDPRRTAS